MNAMDILDEMFGEIYVLGKQKSHYGQHIPRFPMHCI